MLRGLKGLHDFWPWRRPGSEASGASPTDACRLACPLDRLGSLPSRRRYAVPMAKDQNKKRSAKTNKPKLAAKEKKAKKLAKKAK